MKIWKFWFFKFYKFSKNENSKLLILGTSEVLRIVKSLTAAEEQIVIRERMAKYKTIRDLGGFANWEIYKNMHTHYFWLNTSNLRCV